MAKCSIRSCNDTAIAGFAEEIEVGSMTFPRRTIPGTTRYWCRQHSCLALETQGRLGHPIDLLGATGASAAATDDQDGGKLLAFPPPVSESEAMSDDSNCMRKTVSQSATGDRRRRERFRVDGLAEVCVANSGIVFRGLTGGLSHDGCYIQSNAYLSASVGEAVEIRFSVSDVHFRASAKVTAVRRGKGAGFEFLHVEEEAQNNLNTLIEKLSSPTSITAELSPEFASPEFASKDH